MHVDRRALLKVLPLAAVVLTASASGLRAEEAYISRVGGEVIAQNFGGLAERAMQSVNGFMGLKISVADGEHDGLVAEETGGLLIIYMRRGDVELSFPSGYRKDGGRFYFDGFYNVTYAGMNQGINGVHLVPAKTMDVEASAKSIKDFAIGDLPAKGG
ncbi:MAG: hypothetical protein QM744_13770 [Mesorhizobium sp.]